MTIRKILEMVAANMGKKLTFIPIPWKLIWAGLKVCEMMRLPVGFRSDSLVSLVNQNPNPDFEMTRRLGKRFREFNDQHSF
jgi:hypothetical protein